MFIYLHVGGNFGISDVELVRKYPKYLNKQVIWIFRKVI